jgi:hypothetical protein
MGKRVVQDSREMVIRFFLRLERHGLGKKKTEGVSFEKGFEGRRMGRPKKSTKKQTNK